jgi:carbonic anhydrase
MDARIDPAAAFGIDLGDAHVSDNSPPTPYSSIVTLVDMITDHLLQVIRNAGGSAKDALRSLVISQQLLGTNEILLIKHTGCGMTTFQNPDAASYVQKNLGDEGINAIKEGFGSEFLPFGDLEGQVKSEVEWLKESKAIAPKTEISGWVYECETGKVKSVK